MPTKHLFYPQPRLPLWSLYLLWACLLMVSFAIDSQLNSKVAGLFFLTCLIIGLAIKHYVYGQKLGFTLTETHFQQHLYKGGWVLRWHNIKRIDTLDYSIQGWTTSIPWIGIEIKDYQAFISTISPKVITQILLHQRSLLFLGLKQHSRQHELEDHIINDKPFLYSDGSDVKGLKAMLANRMTIQKQLWGYDLFIAESDVIISKEEFVGLARRYLAASHSGANI